MARLIVAYDPEGRLEIPRAGEGPPEVRYALLDIAEGADIYTAAKKLAEMLLEQIDDG